MSRKDYTEVVSKTKDKEKSELEVKGMEEIETGPRGCFTTLKLASMFGRLFPGSKQSLSHSWMAIDAAANSTHHSRPTGLDDLTVHQRQSGTTVRFQTADSCLIMLGSALLLLF
jgi:hypothetical protein